MRRILSLGLLALSLGPAFSAHAGAHPREAGDVRWGRDLRVALDASRHSGRPVLVLLQEIPGCATCVGFGQGPLVHPLLVEAIESEFEPVLIYNNRDGEDGATRERLGEPAWNNPVMRFLDASGRDVLPRRDDLYGSYEVAARLVQALRAAHRPVPEYLRLASDGLNGSPGPGATATGPLRHLRRSPYGVLPLASLQAARVDAALAAGQDAAALLSPRQRQLSATVINVLAHSPHALDGLEPPGGDDELAGYRRALVARLAATPAH